ncbi:MAG: hypothetical protein ACE5OP_11930 [Candidatus Glassbacteria bacterium]
MKQIAGFVFLVGISSIYVTNLHTQQILYQEYFTGGSTDLEWHSAWYDEFGDPLTPMEVDSVSGNPSGDGWIGYVQGDYDNLGGLGLAWAGNFSMTDYSMEAEVYITIDSGYYNAIVVRIDTTDTEIRGYQLVANFYSPMGIERIRFRRWSSFPDNIETLAEWTGSEIPGGPPTEDGWHRMKIIAEDTAFRAYWDDQELSGSPIYDSEIDAGAFGVYVFDPFESSTTLVDDIIVRRVGPPYIHREAVQF